jgi:A/G-specific adenine glycosylase
MHQFSTLIKNWYRQNGRKLPWRDTKDPYKIWLSEIILQQTRVDQGMSYYLKFVTYYPQLSDLAQASEDEVLKHWQGLGYYSRARNMHAAAKSVMNNYKGIFPSDYKSILELKGVGDYTASAIASFAFDLPQAVLDGNVFRLLSRYLNEKTPIDSTEGKKIFKSAAIDLLDINDPATHNQAIMEMGAMMCTVKNPNCSKCPLNESCLAFNEGDPLVLPVKSKKTKVRKRYFDYYIISNGNQLLLKKRGPKDIWQGLYDFPLIEQGEHSQEIEDFIKASKTKLEMDGEFKHILSHQHIYAKFWYLHLDGDLNSESYTTINRNEIEEYPMPQLLIRYLNSSRNFNAD